MIPTALFLTTFLVAVPAVALGGLSSPLGLSGVAWCLFVVAVMVGDNRLSLWAHRVYVERHVDRKLSLGRPNSVRLVVENQSRWRLQLFVKDDPPVEFLTPKREFHLYLAPYERIEIVYETTPRRRGRFEFGDLNLRGRSFLGLSLWQQRISAADPIAVYPDIQSVARFDLLLRARRLEDVGFRRVQPGGAGTEFESLREYVQDDEYRHIDWKATARRGYPFTRQYEEERNRTIMLLVDAGRMMSAEVEGLSKLDHAINAALMLAYVALRKDDAVGLIVFADTVRTIVPPRKGKSHLQRILEALYDAQPTLTEPNYRAALYHLHDRARKRSLAVLFTDLMDEQASRRLITHLSATYPRHLPLLVTMSDPEIVAASRRRPMSSEELFERAVAVSLLADRARAMSTLRTHGVIVLESKATELSVALVNHYLELKERLQI